MGYCTRFELEVYQGDKTIQEVLEWAEQDGGFEGLDYAVDNDGESCDSVKWYDHENDMRYLSKYFPDIVLLLSGEGEESGDVWKKYFKGGKMQECQAVLTFEAYDEEKLQ